MKNRIGYLISRGYETLELSTLKKKDINHLYRKEKRLEFQELDRDLYSVDEILDMDTKKNILAALAA